MPTLYLNILNKQTIFIFFFHCFWGRRKIRKKIKIEIEFPLENASKGANVIKRSIREVWGCWLEHKATPNQALRRLVWQRWQCCNCNEWLCRISSFICRSAQPDESPRGRSMVHSINHLFPHLTSPKLAAICSHRHNHIYAGSEL